MVHQAGGLVGEFAPPCHCLVRPDRRLRPRRATARYGRAAIRNLSLVGDTLPERPLAAAVAVRPH